MKTELNFRLDAGWAVEMKGKYFGLSTVDAIRKECKCALPLDRIKNDICDLNMDANIDVSESYARESEKFKESSVYRINCTRGFLNQFVKEQICLNKNEETNEITEAYVKYVLDENAVLVAWKDSGFSETFGISLEIIDAVEK